MLSFLWVSQEGNDSCNCKFVQLSHLRLFLFLFYLLSWLVLSLVDIVLAPHFDFDRLFVCSLHWCDVSEGNTKVRGRNDHHRSLSFMPGLLAPEICEWWWLNRILLKERIEPTCKRRRNHTWKTFDLKNISPNSSSFETCSLQFTVPH